MSSSWFAVLEGKNLTPVVCNAPPLVNSLCSTHCDYSPPYCCSFCVKTSVSQSPSWQSTRLAFLSFSTGWLANNVNRGLCLAAHNNNNKTQQKTSLQRNSTLPGNFSDLISLLAVQPPYPPSAGQSSLDQTNQMGTKLTGKFENPAC